MKKILYIPFILFLFGFTKICIAQNKIPTTANLPSNPTFEEVKDFYKQIVDANNDGHSDGINEGYLRFVTQLEYKINKNATIDSYAELMKAYIGGLPINSSGSTLESNWKGLGPFEYETSSLGRVLCVWVSSTNPNKILIGTQSSGIWRTLNGTATKPQWECITNNIPALGVSSIAVLPSNEDIIYASTNFSGSYTTMYGAGIVYSNNGGIDWTIEKPTTTGLPADFLTSITKNDRYYKMPLVFKPGTSGIHELFIARDGKIWKKNVTDNGGTWNTSPVLEIPMQSWDAHLIFELDFAPTNPNFVISTGVFRSENEIKYSNNGGDVNTWNNFDFGTIFDESLPIVWKTYSFSTFIPNNSYAYILAKAENGLNNGDVHNFGYLLKFNISNGVPQLVKQWPISDVTKLEYFNHGFTVVENANGYYAFMGKQKGTSASAFDAVVFGTTFNDNSTSINFNKVSNYWPYEGDHNTHADIRDLIFVNNKVYIATDGGISRNDNFCQQNSWVNLNGIGLAITEHLGFDNSEFDKEFYLGGAMDGNSFTHTKGATNNGYSVDNAGDQFDAAIPKLAVNKNKFVKTFNGDGVGGPSSFRGSKGNFNPPLTQDPVKQLNYSLKQFEFEDGTDHFLTGTSDVFLFNNLFTSTLPVGEISSWVFLSRSNKNVQGGSLSNTKTDGPITSFQFCNKPNEPQIKVAVYAIKDAVPIGTTPCKLMKVEYNTDPTVSNKYTYTNITPYTIDNITNNENSLFKSWIQDIVIDQNNPDRIWVCFGGTTDQFNVTGRIYQRDLNSNGTAYEWRDVSNGLPPFPVLSMVYWKGTDDIIFAGTDVGVYVFDKSSTSWKPFMNNLPYVTVPELDINYCSGTLRACTSGRGFWETPLPNIAFEDELPIEVASNQIWNTSRDTYQSILVKSGATLTIEGIHNGTTNINSVEIRIPKDKQIMVEPGGKLIIDGATITNHCDLWQGIEVYGQKTELQTGEEQGWVVIKNGAIIENARTGVTTSKVYDWGWDPNSTGGIVHCYNSTFRNNRRDIELLSYHRTTTKKTEELANRAVFSKCLFITDDNYLFGTSKPVHITMWDVNGASIIGSTFEDVRTVPSGSIGIYTISSGFNVNEYCVGSTQVPVSSSPACSGIQSKFKNLEYGIYAMNVSNPRYSVNVSNSLFDKCSRAIYLNGVNYSSVFLNNFNVKRHNEMVTNEYNMNRYGVYLDLCKSYKVEENSFIGDVDVETETQSFGIVVRNMHGENTQVYKNYFNLLSVGIEAIAQNRSRELDKGLQIKCNDFNESKYDIVVLNDPEVPSPTDVAGIGRTQGYPNSNFPGQLAGNLFGNSSNYLVDNFVNQCRFLEYFHHDPGTESRVEPLRYRSQSRISLMAEGDEYVSSIACPTSFTNVFNASQLRTSVITAGAHLEENIEALTAMVDAGNTEDFLIQSNFYDVGSVNSNYFLLMNTAPYLSVNVLKLVVEDGTAFSNAMIRNILVACSQSAKDVEIQSRLDQRTNPLPQYMRDQIDLGLVEMSSMEEDERQIGTYKLMIDNSVSETMWRATQDTLDLSEDIFEIFNEVEDYMFKLQLVDWIDADNRKNDANNLLDEIGNNIESEDLEGYNIYRDMRDFSYFINDEDLEADRLDGGYLDFLSSYLSFPNSNISYAMALLKLNNQLNYIEPLMIPEDNSDRVVNLNPEKIITELDQSESSLEVSPNPATDLITAKYKILEKSNNLQLVITDINGRELYSQKLVNQIDEIILNCSAFIPGNYFITIKGDGIKSLNQKVIISRK